MLGFWLKITKRYSRLTNTKKGIKFKPLFFYFQKQKRLSKKKEQILIEQVKSAIIVETIPNNFWLKIILAMTYVLNLLLIFLLNRLSSNKASTRLFPN